MDDYYLKYIKYKTKYINFRERQSGGAPPFSSLFSSINERPATQLQLQARAHEDNIQLYKDLIQKYQALLFKLKYIYYKIESSKYYSTNPSFIKGIQLNIDEYIRRITAEIELLDKNKLENNPFDKRLNKLHDNYLGNTMELLRVLRGLDKFIEDTIIKQVSPEATVVKERYDDFYKIYADMSTELYNTLKDNPCMKRQDEYFKELLEIVKI